MTATTLDPGAVNDPEKVDGFFVEGSHTVTQYAVAYFGSNGRKAFAGPFTKDEVNEKAAELKGFVTCRKVVERRSPWGITPESLEAAGKVYNADYYEGDED